MAKAKTPLANPTNKQVITMPEAGSVPLVRKTSPLSDSPVDVAAQIRARAYQLYQERGNTPGHENEGGEFRQHGLEFSRCTRRPGRPGPGSEGQ